MIRKPYNNLAVLLVFGVRMESLEMQLLLDRKRQKIELVQYPSQVNEKDLDVNSLPFDSSQLFKFEDQPQQEETTKRGWKFYRMFDRYHAKDDYNSRNTGRKY